MCAEAGRPRTSIAELRPLVEGVAFRAKDAGPLALVHEAGAPMSETEIQYVSLLRDLRTRGHFAKAAAETHNPQALSFDSDRAPLAIELRRTAALLAAIKTMPDAPDLAGQEHHLGRLQKSDDETSLDEVDGRETL